MPHSRASPHDCSQPTLEALLGYFTHDWEVYCIWADVLRLGSWHDVTSKTHSDELSEELLYR